MPNLNFLRHIQTPLIALVATIALTLGAVYVLKDSAWLPAVLFIFAAEVLTTFALIVSFARRFPVHAMLGFSYEPKPAENADEVKTELESKVPGLIKSLDDPEKFNKWIQDLLESSGDDDTSHDEPTG